MKKIVIIFCVLLIAKFSFGAGVKLSEMDALTSPSIAAQLYIVQGGSNYSITRLELLKALPTLTGDITLNDNDGAPPNVIFINENNVEWQLTLHSDNTFYYYTDYASDLDFKFSNIGDGNIDVYIDGDSYTAGTIYEGGTALSTLYATDVGDCTGGACLDGSATGGETISLYDGDSNKGTLDMPDLSGDITITFPSSTSTLLATDGVGTSLTALNGENIQDDTIDDDSIDFTDVTLTDLTFDVGSVSKTEYGYLDGVTSAIQTQIDGKEPLDADIAKVNEVETLTANWVNTANPWADNEVANALTVTAQSGSTWDIADSVTETSVYSGTTSLDETTAADDSGASIVGVFDEFDNSSSANVQDVLDDLDAAITAAGGGDVTGVGNCSGGACLDGTDDGGTTLSLYDGDSHKGTIDVPDITGDVTYTLPAATCTLLATDGVGTNLTALDGENIQDDTIDDDSIDFTDVTLTDLTFDVGSVDTTEFGYLDGVTSAIQTQLNAKESADANITKDDEVETLTANWVNTANPWADNEVADTLTVTAQAGSTWDVADSITNTSVYSGTTSLDESTAADDSGAYIIGVFDEFDNSDATNLQDVLDDLDAAITGGGGDVTGVGNCASGACLDGTSDGGTTISLYDGDSHKGTIDVPDISEDVTYTLPSSTSTLLATDGDGSSLTNVVTAATVGAVSASLDDTDATVEWEDATDLDENGALNTGSVADNEIDYSEVTLTDFDYQTAWRIFYSNGSGDVTELAFGANGTFLESNGTTSAPAFRALVEADISNAGTTFLLHSDVDDTPVNGETTVPISSNWAYDLENAADPFSVYKLESEMGTASTRDAEDTLTEGSNLPDGLAVANYVASEISGFITSVNADTTPDLGGPLNLNNQIIYDAHNSISDGDTTPDVSGGTNFITANGGPSDTTITNFDAGGGSLQDGQFVFVTINDSYTKIGFSAAGLSGHDENDWEPSAGDWMMCQYHTSGTVWDCMVSRWTYYDGITIGGFGTANRVIYSDASQNAAVADNSAAELHTSGSITGGIEVVSKTGDYTIGSTNAYEAYGGLIFNLTDSTRTFTLPSAVGGMSVCVLNGQGVSSILRLDAASGDYIVLDGTKPGTAGEYIGSSGAAADQVCVVARNTEDWYVTSKIGTWTAE